MSKTKTKQTYYKVVKLIGEKEEFASMVVTRDDVRYRVGKWTKSPALFAEQGYGLFCFDNLRDAAHAARVEGKISRQLFTCEVRGKILTSLLPQWVSIYIVDQVTSAKDFRDCIDPSVVYEDDHWPNGTVMVDAIKLVRQLSWEEVEKELEAK